MPTPLSELMHAAQAHDGHCTAEVPDDWLQGRSVFGGLQVALALKAMRSLQPSLPLRTLQTLFAAPVPGGLVQAQAQVIRTGKSTAHVEARILNGADTLALVVGVFGAARGSVVSVIPEQAKVDCKQPIPFRYMPGITPNFIQHFESTWLRGTPPFTGQPVREIVVNTRMIDTGTASEAHVIAIADLIPPIALSHLRKPSPGSSMTWMLEFIANDVAQLALNDWRVDAELVFAGDGYTSQSAMIWGPGGVPVALSRQSMVVFG
jgi:acyl-CoA thioesterase